MATSSSTAASSGVTSFSGTASSVATSSSTAASSGVTSSSTTASSGVTSSTTASSFEMLVLLFVFWLSVKFTMLALRFKKSNLSSDKISITWSLAKIIPAAAISRVINIHDNIHLANQAFLPFFHSVFSASISFALFASILWFGLLLSKLGFATTLLGMLAVAWGATVATLSIWVGIEDTGVITSALGVVLGSKALDKSIPVLFPETGVGLTVSGVLVGLIEFSKSAMVLIINS